MAQDGVELGGSSKAMPISPLAARGMAEAVAGGQQPLTQQQAQAPTQQQQFYWDGSAAAGEPVPSAEPTNAADPAALQREIEWCREEITRSRNMYQEGEFVLSTVTFCANPAYNLTCSPSYIFI